MKQRIQQIMDREGMTPGRFADSIGIQRSALSHILNGRNNPSLDVITKIINRFDYLSTDWLMFGNAPMFKHQAQENNSTASSENLEDSSFPQTERIVIRESEKSKTVSRIMIFYSDNTFENFVPESSIPENLL